MEYDPRRYACGPTERPTCIDRWTTETRRNYTRRDQQPSGVVLAGRPAPPPPAPAAAAPKPQRPTVSALAQTVASCEACAEKKNAATLCPLTAPGQVEVQRPPFHCYKVDSVNVFPPRPIREADDATPAATGQSRPSTGQSSNAATRIPSAGGVGCRFCHHDAYHAAEGDGARRAELFGLRREAAQHLRHKHKHKRLATKSNASVRGPLGSGLEQPSGAATAASTVAAARCTTGVPPDPRGGADEASLQQAVPVHRRWAQFVSTNLVLCGSCGQVVRREDNENGIAHFLELPCEGCGVSGRMMRLVAEDCSRAAHRDASKAAQHHTDPMEAPRPRTPLDEVADAVRLLPGGVVPMVERRTALGERIHVGRARVPSPSRSAMLSTGGNPPTGDTLKRWLEEPQSANDSTKAKLCLTWGS